MQLFVKHQLSDVEGYTPPSGQWRDYQKSRKRCKISTSRSLEAKHFIGGGREATAIREFCSAVFSTFCLIVILHPTYFTSFRSSNIPCIGGIIICFMLCGFVCFALFLLLLPPIEWLQCWFTGLPSSYLPCCFSIQPLFQRFYPFQCADQHPCSLQSVYSVLQLGEGG